MVAILPWNSWSLNFDDRFPIYQQIVAQFCRSFVKGEIQPGERIPSIRDMALVLKVNANTIQRTYQEMERSGLIGSKRGTGYFFTEDSNMISEISSRMARESIGRFLDEMRAMGLSDEQILAELASRMKGDQSDDAAASDKGN